MHVSSHDSPAFARASPPGLPAHMGAEEQAAQQGGERGLPFNEEAEELLRVAAAIQAAGQEEEQQQQQQPTSPGVGMWPGRTPTTHPAAASWTDQRVTP